MTTARLLAAVLLVPILVATGAIATLVWVICRRRSRGLE
jgi:hypothetical protein